MTRDDPAAFAPPPAFGPFRVLHQIGVGALGPVFRTYEPTRDRLIAVKVFRLDVTPEQAQSLADELSKAAEAGLFHPSIVEPVAAGLEGTVAYRAEEYVAAESLDAAIRHYAPAPIDKALPFITQLAGAIDFARAAGIGHGALHLRDIFVTPEEARASGFGVVEALERTGLRAPVRRPYSAPERIAGGAWGTPADVFSLAAIAYELLSGRRPAGTGAEVLPLATGEAGAHAVAISQVLARAMDADPGARYATALGFASALEAAAARETAAAPAVAPRVMPVAAATPAVSSLDTPSAADPEEPDHEEVDDIAVERDDDEAYYGLAAGGSATQGEEPGELFDDAEAEEDLALAPPPGRQAGGIDPRYDGDALNSAAAGALLDLDDGEDSRPPAPATGAGYGWGDAVAPVAATRLGEQDYREPPAVGPPRTPMLPYAVGLILGLLIGFAAGYAIFGRDPAPSPGEELAAVPPGVTAEPSPAAGGVPSDTEQRLSPPDVPNEVPTPDPVPVATTGSITVESTPTNAGVTINKQWRGRTPLTLEDQPFGAYDIRVVQDGFTVANERVILNAGAPQSKVSVLLERTAPAAAPRTQKPPAPRPQAKPAPRPQAKPPAAPVAFLGSMFVDSRPQGARVLLNGKVVGTTPLRLSDLAIGSHVVRLELDAHRVWSTSARVQAGEEARVSGSLEPIR